MRTIPIHPLTLEALTHWRDADWRAHIGRACELNDAVFPGLSGDYVYHQHAARYLRTDLIEAELPSKVDGFNLDNHSLRRSFFTMLADSGVEESVRVVLGGHKAKTVADRHYTARNLPRFVPAIHALGFEAVRGVRSLLPDNEVAPGRTRGPSPVVTN